MANKVTPSPFPDLDKIDNKTIGLLVKAQRTNLGITQETAAGLCGITLRTIGKIEDGAEGVRLKSVLVVLLGLGIKIKMEGMVNDLNNL